MHTYTRDDLINLSPNQAFFVGVDSDGCVFDTMDLKQKRFFHPQILKSWGLEAIETQVREVAEFVNLYSKWRGTNRFVALLKCFELLHERPEVHEAGVTLPDTASMQAYVDAGLPLGNPSLQQEAERTGDPELQRLLDWSLAINVAIAADMGPVPPFKGVRQSLERMQAHADVIVVSQTPEEALVREWREHGLDTFIRVIAGQELGAKSEHLRMAAGGKYAPEKAMMIGDAPGDWRAAQDNNAFFFPIMPGREEVSWERFVGEAFDRFLDGTYADEYEQTLIREYEALLPETPPWKKSDQ